MRKTIRALVVVTMMVINPATAGPALRGLKLLDDRSTRSADAPYPL
ncbi:hypothetical protein OIU34_18495 [Pararhizobium sp. BT-229]|nr:hypothetical protein [Pararhizobium sp. BT-229]MCV9963869.1 hypothetical protein [Pararhizobium sp. BT-229]